MTWPVGVSVLKAAELAFTKFYESNTEYIRCQDCLETKSLVGEGPTEAEIEQDIHEREIYWKYKILTRILLDLENDRYFEVLEREFSEKSDSWRRCHNAQNELIKEIKEQLVSINKEPNRYLE